VRFFQAYARQVLALVAFSILSIVAAAQTSYTISPSSKNFGSVTVGMVSGSTSFTVTNTGTTTITVNSYTLSAPQFLFFTGWAPKTLPPGQHTSYEVKFAPDSVTSFSGSITIYVNNTANVIPLTGSGKAAKEKVSLSTTSLSFAATPAGQSSITQPVTINNKGTGNMTVNSVTVDPPFFVSGFSGKSTVIPAGGSLPLQVSFIPSAAGAFNNVMVIAYDALPANGVALTGVGTTATTLALTTFPTLPLATQNHAYQVQFAGGGGAPPYTYSLASGSTLPAGLMLSSSGLLSGTLASTVGLGTYSFGISVQDSSAQQSTTQYSMTVLAPTGSSCDNTIWYMGQTGTPGVALNDLGTGTYLGQQGGLYPNGSNVRPADHDADGVSIAQGIQPLDANGNPSPTGKIGVLSLGMSDTFDVFLTFMTDANADPTKNPAVVFVPGAQPRASAALFASPNNAIWNPIFQNFLPQAGLTANQVVVAWVNDGNYPTGNFPSDMYPTQGNLESIAQNLHTKFPNLKLAYFGSRFYAGYSNGTRNPANPEPWAYQHGFAVKWAIQDQLNGLASLNYNPALGPVKAPWMAWGLYDWSNGMLGRSDGLVWTCQDMEPDGTHPSKPYGREKDANMLLNFFKTDSTTTPWFLAH